MVGYIPFPDWLGAEIIPGLPFRWYGMMYLVAFGVTYLLFIYQLKKRAIDYDKDEVVNMFFWAILALLIGARVFAALLFDPTNTYWREPWRIFWPFSNGQFTGLQGMNYYGGLLGAAIAMIIYGRKKGIDIRDWGDMIIAGVPLGYTFGRLGNFINGELYGRITDVSWAVMFPHARRLDASDPFVREVAASIGMELPESGLVNMPRHPTQIYEGLTEGVLLWVVMWFVFRKMKLRKGTLLGIYLIGYGLPRFLIDYLRVPLRGRFALRLSEIPHPPYVYLTPLNFIASQFYALGMILLGIGIIWWVYNKDPGLESAAGGRGHGGTQGAGGGKTAASDAARRRLRKKLRK
jgi:phosphatidylglycerol---prolipoprotein diacylglyceryl transferase